MGHIYLPCRTKLFLGYVRGRPRHCEYILIHRDDDQANERPSRRELVYGSLNIVDFHLCANPFSGYIGLLDFRLV